MEDDKLGRPIILLLSHMKKFLIILVMLIAASWQYGQVVKQREVEAGSGCNKEPDKGECEAIEGCKWIPTPKKGIDKGRCEEDGQKPRRRPSPSPKPSPSISPSPSPSISPSPSPVPSPLPGTANFAIRKFNDADKDGSWDGNEGSTDREWQFQYRLNDGDWHDYITPAGSGWGNTITVDKDTKIEINEIEQSGWTNTTGLTLIKILEENKVYYFDFGNFRNPDLVEASPPAVVPEAGRGFYLQPWLIIAGIGVALQIAALLL